MFKITRSLLAAGVFGDGFGSFTDSVLGQFSWQQKTDSCLDLPRCDGRSLIVVSETGSLGGNSFKNVVDKAVHDGHCLAGNTSVWVDLSQDFVDVDGIGFPPSPLPFLVTASTGSFGLGNGLFGSFGSNLWWHVYSLKVDQRILSPSPIFLLYQVKRIERTN